jgi:hypothetical protein
MSMPTASTHTALLPNGPIAAAAPKLPPLPKLEGSDFFRSLASSPSIYAPPISGNSSSSSSSLSPSSTSSIVQSISSGFLSARQSEISASSAPTCYQRKRPEVLLDIPASTAKSSLRLSLKSFPIVPVSATQCMVCAAFKRTNAFTHVCSTCAKVRVYAFCLYLSQF